MIEERSIAVAVCDACGHQDYADDLDGFLGGNGYTLTIVEHKDHSKHKIYSCKQTHIGKSARVVLDRWHSARDTMPPDAPPLPRIIGDTQEVTQ